VANFISEDDIEKAIIKVFTEQLKYRHINCFTADAEDLNDGSQRKNKTEVVLGTVLFDKLKEFNPDIPEDKLIEVVEDLKSSRASMSKVSANKEVYKILKDSVKVNFKNSNGKEENRWVQVINFDEPVNNDFLVVSQLWIKGSIRFRRPDLLLYVNGIPIGFIELKNSNVSARNAYDDNLTTYKAEIPTLFNYNQVCILSNGLETKVGSFDSGWEFFKDWLRIDDEKEKIDRKAIAEEKVSLKHTVLGLCPKEKLLDYIENFVLFNEDYSKIVAMNHQFIGVNNAVSSFENRIEKRGRLGVFWHTQGSGKSFSMVMFAAKINRKFKGNYTFLIVTDREDLDRQIYKTFLRVGLIKKGEKVQPNSSETLREYLKTNKSFIFTLIQKFRYEKGKDYPVLSDRDDIIVIVDEAHRTQYEGLAENMRRGLPNAQYIAFTGTPLLGKEKKTNAWFGGYVSEYNFAQAIEDGATVPLFYHKRVPEVLIQNDDLDEDFADIVADENLTEEQQQKLIKEYANEMQVIKRDDRLEIIARDIVDHFPRRGYKGKGMVISVDKFTAVKMYNKVQYHWKEEMKKIQKQINSTISLQERDELKEILKYMQTVEMAVIISEEAGEEEKFINEDLDILPHRKKMKELDDEGHDIEYKFKDPNDKLQLVFVCAMWLTGFDVPTLSTLYLDKPMKNHTLMQTIARANRVAEGKTNGLIVDYYNVFRNMKKALASYGGGNNGGLAPVEDKKNLFKLLDGAVKETIGYCDSIEIDLTKLLDKKETFKNINLFGVYADKLLSKDEWKKQFKVYVNTMEALYEACRPEIANQPRRPMVDIIRYLTGVIEGKLPPPNIDKAKKRVDDLLDNSIFVDEEFREKAQKQSYSITNSKLVDLSKLDFDKIKEAYKEAEYKNIEIADLRTFIEQKLNEMMSRNVSRVNFAEKLQNIIARYNAGGMLTDNYFDDLMNFAKDLRTEEERHVKEGLTEEELELYDLLKKDSLSKEDLQKVKLASKELLTKLKDNKAKILKVRWFADEQSRLNVKDAIDEVLDMNLPDTYDRILFKEKSDTVFKHIYDLAVTGRGWAGVA
jgi:type I restriction enzyme, R subunit